MPRRDDWQVRIKAVDSTDPLSGLLRYPARALASEVVNQSMQASGAASARLSIAS